MVSDLFFSVVNESDAELCLRYWARDSSGNWAESVDALGIAFSITPEKLEAQVSQSSVAYASHVRCPICYWPRGAPSRVHFERLQLPSQYALGPCENVSCHHSVDVRNTVVAWNRRADIVEEALRKLGQKLLPIDYSQLEPIDAFFLYCVLAASKREWYSNELPAVASHKIRLAPTAMLVEMIYSRLHTLQILSPSLHSPIFAFNIGDFAHSAITFNTHRVCWTLPANIVRDNNHEIFLSLRKRLQALPEKARQDLRVMLIEHECLGQIVRHIGDLGILVDRHMETQLRTSIRSILKEIPISVTQTLIALVLSSAPIEKAIRTRSPRDISKFISDAFSKNLEMILCYKPVADINDAHANKILLESTSLISRVFSKQMVER